MRFDQRFERILERVSPRPWNAEDRPGEEHSSLIGADGLVAVFSASRQGDAAHGLANARAVAFLRNAADDLCALAKAHRQTHPDDDEDCLECAVLWDLDQRARKHGTD